MSSTPPLSVIVINSPDASAPPDCLESIWQQRAINLEVIVVVRSNGAMPPWLEAQRDRVTPVVSASESSPHTAANRGLNTARGEWVVFLRPEDRLVGDMILSECLNWMRKTEAGVVAGEVACNDGRILKLRSHPNAIARDFLPDSATFYRRSLFAENGEFDPALVHQAAYDFHLRLWKGRVRFKPIPLRVVASDRRKTFTWPACREERQIRHRYFSLMRSAPWDIAAMLRCLTKR